jgi:nucleoside-diphosphate-sugar epimerase
MTEFQRQWSFSLPGAIPRLLITGGSGFIGTNAAEMARQAGIPVCNFDIRPPRCAAHVPVWQQGDLLDAGSLRKHIGAFHPTHVLHLAARTDLDETRHISGYAANTDGVANLLDALDRTDCRRVVFASSMLVCRNGYQPRQDHEYCPDTLYGESKVQGENLVRRHNSGFVWSIVRPTSIWGSWFGAPYRQFFHAVSRGLYRHPGPAEIEKALGYVGNTVWQLYRILAAPDAAIHSRTFYLSDYEPLTTRRWANLIAQEFGSGPVRQLPMPLMRMAAFAGDLAQTARIRAVPLTSFRLRNMLTPSRFDLREIADISGPLPFTVEQGVKETVAWLAANTSS